MRFAFFLLGLFLVFMTARARELTTNERLLLTPYETNTKQVKEYFEESIDSSTLSWGDWLALKGFMRSCDPLRLQIAKIAREDDTYPDQSKTMAPLYALCSEGTLSLAKLYIKARR